MSLTFMSFLYKYCMNRIENLRILPIIDVIIYLAEICKDRLYTLFGTGSESLKRSRTIVALSRSNLCNSILAIFER
jgi:hypothetical protein